MLKVPCNATCAAEIERLQAAIRRALGEVPDENGLAFGEVANDLEESTKRRYWWRTHLRKLAALEQMCTACGSIIRDKQCDCTRAGLECQRIVPVGGHEQGGT